MINTTPRLIGWCLLVIGCRLTTTMNTRNVTAAVVGGGCRCRLTLTDVLLRHLSIHQSEDSSAVSLAASCTSLDYRGT